MKKNFNKATALFSTALLVGSTIPNTVAAAPLSGKIVQSSDAKIISQDTPNILWIVYDHVTFHQYKNTEGAKPILSAYERLASEGIEFNRAHSILPICSPARACMLTGTYPISNGVLTNSDQDDMKWIGELPAYNEYLQKNGYSTAWFGKNHAHKGNMSDLGFDGWSPIGYGNPYASQEYKDYLAKYNLSPATYHMEWAANKALNGKEVNMTQVKNFAGSDETFHNMSSGYFANSGRVHEADMLVDMTSEYITNSVQNGNKFFVSLNIWGPHQPYTVPQETKDLINPSDIQEYPNYKLDQSDRPRFVQQNRTAQMAKSGFTSWEQWQPVIARVYEEYSYVEMAVSRLLDYLDENGLAENTAVILTADHGDEIGSYGGLVDKCGNQSEEAMHIPLVIRWPGKIAPGTKSDALVSNVDIAPTVIEMGGVEAPAHMDGKSMLPIFNGNEDDFRTFMGFSFGHLSYRETQRALYYGDFKYVATAGDVHELYDITHDPFQLNNLINNPAAVYTIEDMRAKLLEVMDEVGDNRDIQNTKQLRAELNSTTPVVDPETGSVSQGGASNTSSHAIGDTIWAENFNSADVKELTVNDVKSLGFDFYSDKAVNNSDMTQNSAQFRIKEGNGGNNSLSFAKPQNVPLGRDSVFTLAKKFDTPLKGKFSVRMKVDIDNFPPGQANYENNGNVGAERWIYLSDSVLSDNSKPENKAIAFAFVGAAKAPRITSESGSASFSLKTWNDVEINVDTDAGMYDISVNGKELQPPTSMPYSSFSQLGLYAHSAGSGISIDDLQIVTLKEEAVEQLPDGVSVVLKGKRLEFDQPPIIVEDRTLVPMRKIFEELGAEVEWDDATETVTATKDSKEIKLTIGNKTVTINGEPFELDVPAMIVNDRTLVPIRFISESLSMTVNWVEATSTVTID